MTRLPFCLLLAAALAACSSPPTDASRAEADAAHAAAAQALAATAPPEGKPIAPWLKSERARIHTERAQASARFEQDEKDCWQRFAVNSCLRQARTQRRAVQDRLRQEELAINEVERKRTSAERLQKIEQKTEQKAGR